MPKRLLKQKSSSSDSFIAISGLYQTAEPQEALWHINEQNLTRYAEESIIASDHQSFAFTYPPQKWL